MDEVWAELDEPAIWIDCEDCGEVYNALDEGECPYCDEDREEEMQDDD